MLSIWSRRLPSLLYRLNLRWQNLTSLCHEGWEWRCCTMWSGCLKWRCDKIASMLLLIAYIHTGCTDNSQFRKCYKVSHSTQLKACSVWETQGKPYQPKFRDNTILKREYKKFHNLKLLERTPPTQKGKKKGTNNLNFIRNRTKISNNIAILNHKTNSNKKNIRGQNLTVMHSFVMRLYENCLKVKHIKAAWG